MTEYIYLCSSLPTFITPLENYHLPEILKYTKALFHRSHFALLPSPNGNCDVQFGWLQAAVTPMAVAKGGEKFCQIATAVHSHTVVGLPILAWEIPSDLCTVDEEDKICEAWSVQ